VNVENRSEEDRNVTAVLSASSVFYTGATAHRLKKAQGTFSLPPSSRETLEIVIPPEDYIHKLVDHNLIKIYAIANVQVSNLSKLLIEREKSPIRRDWEFFLSSDVCLYVCLSVRSRGHSFQAILLKLGRRIP